MIDSEEEVSVDVSLLGSQSSRDVLRSSLTSSTDETQPRYQNKMLTSMNINNNSTVNGNVVYLMAQPIKRPRSSSTEQRNKYNCNESMSIQFPTSSDMIPVVFKEECKIVGLQVPERILVKLINLVNNAPMLQNYFLFFRWYGIAFFMAMYFVIANIITVVLIGIMMALFEGRSGKGYDLSLAMPAVFANILTFTPCILFVYFIRRKKRVQTSSLMGRLSQELNKRYKFFLYIDILRNGVAALCVVKYDTSECQAYLKEIIEKNEETRYSREATSTEKRIADLVYRTIPDYVESLRKHSHLTTRQRHQTMGHAMCFCQYVESRKLISLVHSVNDDDAVGFDREPVSSSCFATFCKLDEQGEYDAVPLLLDDDDDDDMTQ